MSESLTNDQLESLDKMAGNPAFEDCLGSIKVDRHELCDLISMARRSLQLEERLGKARGFLFRAVIGSCDCMTRSPDIQFHGEDCRYRLIVQAYDLCSPKGLRPPAPATPPVEPDALPLCTRCDGRGGWEGGFAGETWTECPECGGIDPNFNSTR